MSESRINKSCMITTSINQINQSDQSIDHKIMYVGPPPKPNYFCMDQIRKFHYSELQNLILCLFQNIFKTERVRKWLAKRKVATNFY